MIHLYNADCMIALEKMKDNEFDLAIVDPPYGIGDLGFCTQKTTRAKERQKSKNWNRSTPNERYFSELKRVSKRQIIWGANYYSSLTGGRIVWYKHQKHPNMSKCEIAYCSIHQKVEYVDIIWQNVNRKERIIHPCQKPISLYTWLLDKYASQGWKILDTHLGSGSSAIAAHNMGYEFHGYELDSEYYEAAKKRIENHQRQQRLFTRIS